MGWRRGAAALAVVLSLPALGQAPAAPRSDRQEDLQRVRERLQKLQADLARSEESRGEAVDALRASDKAVSDANRELFRLAAADRSLQAEVDSLSRRSAAVRADIARQQQRAASLVRHHYETGGRQGLQVVLAGGNPGDVSRQLAYLDYVRQARAAMLVRLRESARELEGVEKAALARREALRSNRDAQAQESRRLERERAERAGLVKRLAGQVEKNRREVGRLQRDEQRLTRLVEEIARALAEKPARPRAPPDPGKAAGKAGAPAPPRGTPVESVADASASARAFASLRGRLRLPVRGELTHRFGSPREEGGARWRGLFIRATNGESVRAVADGRVVYADWLRGFGNLLILDHGGGYMSLYGNNEGLLRAVGENVRGGDPVAQVGSTGGGSESGLYFELRQDGKPFDPMTWVSR